MIFSHLFLALEERLCQIPSIELLKANLAEPKVAVSHFFGFFIFLFGQTALKLSDHESSFMGWRGQIEKKKSLFRNNVFNRRLPSADPLNSSRVQAAQEKKKKYRKQTSSSLNLTLMDRDPQSIHQPVVFFCFFSSIARLTPNRRRGRDSASCGVNVAPHVKSIGVWICEISFGNDVPKRLNSTRVK